MFIKNLRDLIKLLKDLPTQVVTLFLFFVLTIFFFRFGQTLWLILLPVISCVSYGRAIWFSRRMSWVLIPNFFLEQKKILKLFLTALNRGGKKFSLLKSFNWSLVVISKSHISFSRSRWSVCDKHNWEFRSQKLLKKVLWCEQGGFVR